MKLAAAVLVVLSVTTPTLVLAAEHEKSPDFAPASAMAVMDAPSSASPEIAVSIGGAYLDSLPLLDLRFLYNTGGDLAIDASVTARGDINFVDLGARVGLVRGRVASLALRARAHAEIYGAGPGGLGLGALSPGLMLVLGKPNVHLTLGFDVNLYTVAVGGGTTIVDYVGEGANGYTTFEFSPSPEIGFFAELSTRTLHFAHSDVTLKAHGVTAGIIF